MSSKSSRYSRLKVYVASLSLRSGNGVSASRYWRMSARRRCTRCRASLRRVPSRSERSRSDGRLANSSSSKLRSDRKASSFPLWGVAVTRSRCFDLSAAIRRSNSNRCCRPRPTPPASVQPCASSTITNSGHLRTKSSACRADLMKSVETTVKRWRSNTDTPTGRSRSRR